MIITRHNYEEFFLLYVDNELPLQQREAVEEFVQQNLDLAEEMEMLKQVTLQNENIAFEQKELLFKQAEGISLNNYEQYFLLSVDKELTAFESEEVEKFVLKHPKLQNEYLLLQQARLEAEDLVFTGKEQLYRKAGKERRVIFVNWMRISAAAAIVGLITFTWIFTQKNTQNSLAKNSSSIINKTTTSQPKEIKKPAKAVITEETVTVVPEKSPVKTEIVKRVQVIKAKQTALASNEVSANKIKSKSAKLLDAAKEQNISENPLQKNNGSNDALASTKGLNKNNLPPVHDDLINTTALNNPVNKAETSIIKHAVYREVDNQNEEEEKSFYIGSAEINKNKLKGLFKKATSFFDKKNNKRDGEKTLKIAGFEIKSN